MKFSHLLFMILLYCSSALAVSEIDVKSKIFPLLYPQNHFYQRGNFTSPSAPIKKYKLNPDGTVSNKTYKSPIRLAFFKFVGQKPKNPKGSVVIAPGRTESSLKYTEVAYDLINSGYWPIYSIDHRGQGFSDRMLNNRHKSHVRNFYYYVKDFKYFIDNIVLKDPDVDKRNLHLLAHSLGGGIGTRYLERYSDIPFKSVVMTGAMHKIEFPHDTEFLAWLKTSAVCTYDFIFNKPFKYKDADGKIYPLTCTSYAPGEGDFTWAEREKTWTLLSTSRPRKELRDQIWKTWPEAQLGGATTSWVQQATEASRVLRAYSELEKVKTPILLISGGKDHRVTPESHALVCKRLNRAHSGLCKHITYPTSKHEILMETDNIRSSAVAEIINFFGKNTY